MSKSIKTKLKQDKCEIDDYLLLTSEIIYLLYKKANKSFVIILINGEILF